MSAANWRTTRLSRAVSIRSGRDFAEVADPDGEFPVFGSGGEFARASEYLYCGQGVIFGRKGTINRPTPVNGKFWVTDTGYFVEPKSGVLDARFLSYWSLRFPFRYYATDTALPSMTRSDIGCEPISVPPLVTQHSIADYLDHETAEIDALIADLGELDTLTAERCDNEREQLFAVHRDNRLALRRLELTIRTGVSVNASSYPALSGTPGVLKTGAVSRGFFDPYENKAVEDPIEERRLTCPVRGDTIVVNRANTPDLVGSAAYVSDDHPRLFLSDLLWEVTTGRASHEFLSQWMQTYDYREQITLIRTGASSSMQKIAKERFMQLVVPIPDSGTQLQIAERASAIAAGRRSSSAEITRAIALAKERRAALITAAVTGQIDVTATRRPAAEQLEDDIKELT
ncbi:type I restriction enzyme S subunit [Brachybacterium muris]|uniref:hypothetical protein n=1 Tax=Brachybacterium muris TaxID=219301 RepID=UPI00195A50B2|nr:hypothetical protein [Brachybacterium muris]MBM7499609.1 type I restriction enzyme S subunit [Brachybacterium muris]